MKKLVATLLTASALLSGCGEGTESTKDIENIADSLLDKELGSYRLVERGDTGDNEQLTPIYNLIVKTGEVVSNPQAVQNNVNGEERIVSFNIYPAIIENSVLKVQYKYPGKPGGLYGAGACHAGEAFHDVTRDNHIVSVENKVSKINGVEPDCDAKFWEPVKQVEQIPYFVPSAE